MNAWESRQLQIGVSEGFKKCSHCFETKLLSEYTKCRKGKCLDCSRAYHRAYTKTPKSRAKDREYRSGVYHERQLAVQNTSRHNLKLQTLIAYSKTNPPSCECCSEAEYQFLSLDHINGGGNAERRKFGDTYNLMAHLRQSNWPEGYRVLCFSCNLALGRYGYCPHKTEQQVYKDLGALSIKKRCEVKLRLLVLSNYGGKCACCGESEYEFLSIDHINGDRREDTKLLGFCQTNMLYRYLRNHNYPTNRYQLLCYNCNCAKGFFGACPHKKETV